jgi:hypothetical protein
VPEAGTKIAAENDSMVARLDYRAVATHDGRTSGNDGGCVMEEVAERVHGVTDTERQIVSAAGISRHRSPLPTSPTGCEHTTFYALTTRFRATLSVVYSPVRSGCVG